MARTFRAAFTRACESIAALQQAEEKSPGVVSESVGHRANVALAQIKVLRKSLFWLEKTLKQHKAVEAVKEGE